MPRADGSLDLWPIQNPIVVVFDESADEQILQIDNLPKSRPAYDVLETIIGRTSLVKISGEYWKKLRKMFNPAFAPSHLETLVPAIVQESEVFVDKLNQIADTGEIVKMNRMTTVCKTFAFVADGSI